MDLSGALGILYARDEIDKGIKTNFQSKHGSGQKQALYEFERGKKLNIADLKGDVELFFTLENKVHVVADGVITVTYLDSTDHDVDLKSRWGDIYVEHLNAGPGEGDVKLKADGSVYLAQQSYSGDIGQITAGDDLDMDADGSIELYGVVAAGGDIKMNTHDGDVVIGAAVTAGDDLDIHSGGSLSLTENATLNAGGNIDLFSKEMLIVDANVDAGRDVEVSSCSGVQLNGSVTAGDDVHVLSGDDLTIAGVIMAPDFIDLKAGDDLWLMAGSCITGINGEPAKKVKLFAGENMVIEDAVNLNTVILIKQSACR